jgi:hypothetical protein
MSIEREEFEAWYQKEYANLPAGERLKYNDLNDEYFYPFVDGMFHAWQKSNKREAELLAEIERLKAQGAGEPIGYQYRLSSIANPDWTGWIDCNDKEHYLKVLSYSSRSNKYTYETRILYASPQPDNKLQEAVDRIKDLLMADDGQAYEEAEKFLAKLELSPQPSQESNCLKCNQSWDDHDFGAPEPYCPSQEKGNEQAIMR